MRGGGDAGRRAAFAAWWHAANDHPEPDGPRFAAGCTRAYATAVWAAAWDAAETDGRARRELEIVEANRVQVVDWAIRERQVRVAATARVSLLEGLLRAVEWVNTADQETLYCPRCGWGEEDGHSPGCPLGAALHGREA